MRRLPCVLIPAIPLVLFAASDAFAKPCSHNTSGDIGNRYRALGGSDGPLGCPTNDEENHAEGRGRRQNFEHGQMVWMPDADNRAPGVVAAWQAGNDIVVDWSIGHYNYDVEPPPPPSVTKCPIRPYGSIYKKWLSLNAGNGPLGCPTAPERSHPDGGGARTQDFQKGQISWTPGQGDLNAQAGWVEGNRIVYDWGPSDPFNYDKFLVRWDKDGRNLGQQDIGGNRTRGRWSTAVREAGQYRIVVEGCDNGGFLQGSTCRQGWSKPVFVNYVPPSPDYTPFPVARQPVPPPTRRCNSAGLGGYWLREYWRLGGVNGPMGCFQGMQGNVARFQNGQISVSEDSGDQRVLAAWQDWDGIGVDWWVSMDRPIHTYNKFLDRWDKQGLPHSERDQVDVMAQICDDQAPIPGGAGGCWNYKRTWDLENGKSLELVDTHLYDRGQLSGAHKIPADRGDGVYRFTVEGCDVGWPGGSTCRQSWFAPVSVNFKTTPRRR